MINIRDKGAALWEGWNHTQRTVFAVALIGFVALMPFAGNFAFTSVLDTPIASYQDVLVYPIGMFVLMGLGLNIVVGKSGLLDLGYVAFFAIGAYTQAILSTRTHLNAWEILPIGMGFAMLSGALLGLPTLRLRGDYLAIVTLGFGEIVRIVTLNISITGGTNGIARIPNPPAIAGLKFDIMHPVNYFWLVLTMILLVIWMIRRLSVRRPGRAWEAIRQDEDVAMLMGVPTLRYKIWSFSVGAAVGGAAGVIYAAKVIVIAPQMFTFNISVLILSCIVFGGMGNMWGVIFGGVILAYIPERIRFITNARQLVFGIVLVLIMNIRPDGLLPRKKREKVKSKSGVKNV
ncbi:MAG: branched-chain amino acid ABC transporter permease [Actinomycetes bacterium]|jgi:branched-chain amino acid transport system permease protein